MRVYVCLHTCVCVNTGEWFCLISESKVKGVMNRMGRTKAVGGKEMEAYGWKISVSIFIVLRCQDKVLRSLEEVL